MALFLVTALLRAPSFHPNYFQEDEAFYLTSAQKIVDGGAQYVDTWDNKPPLIVWFYTLFVGVFGSAAIIAIRIFTIGYLFVTALLLSQFVVDNKLIERFSLLPGFLYVVICSVPWYAQELNGELMMNLPIVVAMSQLLRMGDNGKENQRRLFVIGIMLGISFMIKYQSVLVFIGLAIAYFSIATARISETFSLMAGFMMVLFSCVSVVYLTGGLADYWDIGVVYNLDYILAGKNPGEEVSVLFNLWQYVKIWGVFVLVALMAVLNYRLSYYKSAIRIRKVEVVILLWAVSTLLAVAIGGGRLYLHYFYLLVPVLCVYASTFFEFKINGWVKSIAMILLLAMPMYTFAIFGVVAFPDQFEFLSGQVKPNGWVAGMRQNLNEPHPLEKYIDRSKVNNGILVMAYEPTVYARLGYPCATRYTNFSIAYYKLSVFSQVNGYNLISRYETEADIYLEFRDQMPEYIIDPLGLFPYLRDRIPVLFSQYKTRQVNDGARSYKLYFL